MSSMGKSLILRRSIRIFDVSQRADLDAAKKVVAIFDFKSLEV